jgi:hypothetical protein
MSVAQLKAIFSSRSATEKVGFNQNYEQQNTQIMKKIITIMALVLSINTQAQKIISRTTTIGRFANCSIDLTEYEDGKNCYSVWLISSDVKISGTTIIETNKEVLPIKFLTKEKMIHCLKYLYDFNKGAGYLIDLENLSKNTAMSTRKGFQFGSENRFDTPEISQYIIGKLLNSINVSVKKENETQPKEKDDIYSFESPIF